MLLSTITIFNKPCQCRSTDYLAVDTVEDKLSTNQCINTVIIIQEEFEDTKGIIRIRILEKDIQQNGQKKTVKRSTNDLQNTKQKTKDRATRTPLKTEIRG